MLIRVDDDSVRKTLRSAGIVTTARLLAAGKSANDIRRLTRRGALVPAGRGVYAIGARAQRQLIAAGGEHLVQAAAALAVVGPGAVISHQSAARLRGIDLIGKPRASVQLTAPRALGLDSRNGIHLYAAQVPAEHVAAVFGLPATTAARTVIDLARTLDFTAGVVAADSALHRGLATQDDLRSVVVACRQWPGIRRAAQVVEFADKRSESALESIARVVFRDCGLPAPDLQVWLGGIAEPIGRADFYWKQYRTVAEVDGGLKYADPARAKTQLRRDSELRAAGYEVVHFDWSDITQRPRRVAAILREAFVRGRLRNEIARSQAGPSRRG